MNGDRHKNYTTIQGRYADEFKSSSDIRNDINQTRRDIDVTLDAIGNYLNPRHMLDDVLSKFRAQAPTATDAAGKIFEKIKAGEIVEKIKERPLHAALVGVGLAWLLRERRAEEQRRRRHRRGELMEEDESTYAEEPEPSWFERRRARRARRRMMRLMRLSDESVERGPREGWRTGESRERVRGWARSARERLSSAAGRISGGAASARDRVGDAASYTSHGVRRMRDRASRGYESVRDTAYDAAHRARTGIDHGREKIEGVSQDYPVPMGVSCAALGVLAGLLLPRLRERAERQGGRRGEDFRSDVRRAWSSLVEEAKDIADDTARTFRGDVRRQEGTRERPGQERGRRAEDRRAGGLGAHQTTGEGRSSGDVGSDVKQAADAVRDTVRGAVDSARDAIRKAADSQKDKPGGPRQG